MMQLIMRYSPGYLNDFNSSRRIVACQIVRSIITCGNAKARNELKPMVKGLLSRSSVYEKDHLDITKEDLYSISEDFVDLWAHQKDLLKMHQKVSPMVRYELSRVSAALIVAMGTRKIQCQAKSRYGLLNSWFGPMRLDFGCLQRCRKELNVRELEEAMGQALLTLPLKQQYGLFM